MAQHDYVIDNQSASASRADINNALLAIVTQNAGATAPATTYADMFWYDTANNQIKKRNEANSAWITLGTINEATGKFDPNNSFVNNTFVPVQQGGASGMGTNKVYIGWGSAAPGQFKLQVDTTPAGTMVRHLVTPEGQNDSLYAPGSPPLYACRAWVNFDGATAAIRGAGNVSSVSRFGAGAYGVNFAVAMPDANYATTVGGNNSEGNNGYIVVNYQATTQVGVLSRNRDGFSDGSIINVAVFR